MSFTVNSMAELNLLLRYPETSMEGLKIHHDADPDIIAAAQSLFDKGLTTQKDGGYLTDLGRSAFDCARSLQHLIVAN